MFRLDVRGTPAGVPADMVLRLAPHPEMAAKEVAVQRAAAAAGVPTPAIRLSGPAGGPLGEAWAVMDFAPGAPLLADLDGAAAVRRLPEIARRLPAELASAMATIHQLDAAPVVAAVREVAPNTTLTVDELLPHLEAGASTAGRPDLARSVERLVDTRPAERDPVLCHGDVHPLNLLVDGDRVTVLDWTAAVVAPAAYDVAWTWLLLRFPPVVLPGPLRPAVGAAGRLLAARFLRAHRSVEPAADPADLDWYRTLHAARVLVDLALWEAEGDERAATHPGRLMAPGAQRVLDQAGVA
jgi:aminoglycoside phosphotransferase (APT) family kinase protein